MALKKLIKGEAFDCSMFDVRCKSECVSNNLRITSKCPYDNYNSKPTKINSGNKPKGAKSMAKSNKNTNNHNAGKNSFTPTFRKYSDMNEGEQAAFRQGAKTSDNKVKERLGLTKPRQ